MTSFSVRRGRDLRRYAGDDWGRDENGLDLEADRQAEDAVERQSRIRPVGTFSRPEAVRLWLEHEAGAAGFELEELVATVRRGPVPQSEREAYDFLARAVAHLRLQGVTLEAIGLVIGKPRRTVLRLEERGWLVREAANCHSAHR